MTGVPSSQVQQNGEIGQAVGALVAVIMTPSWTNGCPLIAVSLDDRLTVIHSTVPVDPLVVQSNIIYILNDYAW